MELKMQLRSYSIIALLFIALNTHASPKIDPVSVSIARLNINDIDPVEFAYVGIRCGALNNVIGIAFQAQEAAKPKNDAIAKRYLGDGEAFKNVGFSFATVSKQSTQYILTQYEFFLKYYSEEWSTGHKLNNSSWTNLISKEVESCQKVVPMFKEISEIIDKNDPANGKAK